MLRAWLCLLPVAALVASCVEAPPRVAAPKNADERFALELARAACNGVASCCAARKLGAFDESTCETLVRGTLDGMQRLRSESGGGALDPKNAGACLAKIKRYAETCVDPEHALAVLEASACDELFTGGFGPGRACQASEECGLSNGATRADCGEHKTCELLVPAKSGDACAGDCEVDDCGEAPKGQVRAAIEARCDARAEITCDAETHRCRPRAPTGATCDDKHACTTDAFCNGGHCASKGGLGASCVGASDACAIELACDPGSKTCVAKKQTGEACSEDADCASANCAGTCRGKTDATMLHLGRTLRIFCSNE